MVAVGRLRRAPRARRRATSSSPRARCRPAVVFTTLLAANIGAGSTVGATGLGYRHGLSAWWWSGSAAIGCLVLGLLVAPRLHRLAAPRLLHRRRLPRVALRPLGARADLGGALARDAVAPGRAADRDGVGVRGRSPACRASLGGLLSALVLVSYFSGGGLLAAAWVNVLQLATLLVGFGLAVPYAWSAARRLERASSAPGGAGYGSFTGMGVSGDAGARGGLRAVVHRLARPDPEDLRRALGRRRRARPCSGMRWPWPRSRSCRRRSGWRREPCSPGLANPELALPRLATDVLPPWLGALALVALFAAEISTADAVLFMLSTSLSRDLYQAALRPEADDATLLRVGRDRLAAAGGVLGVVLGLVLPSVATALVALLRRDDRGAVRAAARGPFLDAAAGRSRADGGRGLGRDDLRSAPRAREGRRRGVAARRWPASGRRRWCSPRPGCRGSRGAATRAGALIGAGPGRGCYDRGTR